MAGCWQFSNSNDSIFFNAADPVFRHFLGSRDFQRTHDAESHLRAIGEPPDRLGQVRVGHLPFRT